MFSVAKLTGMRRVPFWRKALVGVVAFCLVSMGCWIWLDNRIAIIPDIFNTGERPAAERLELRVAIGLESLLKAPSPAGGAGLPAGWVEGNGDGDDYFEPPAKFKLGHETLQPLKNIKARAAWGDRRLVAAYKDFGHLKVAPAAGIVSNFINVRSSATAVWPSHILWGGLTAFGGMESIMLISQQSWGSRHESDLLGLRPCGGLGTELIEPGREAISAVARTA